MMNPPISGILDALEDITHLISINDMTSILAHYGTKGPMFLVAALRRELEALP